MKSTYKKEQITNIAKKFRLKLLNYTSYGSLYKQNAVFRIEADRGIFSLKPFFGRVLSDLNTIQQMKKAAELVRIIKEHEYPHMPKWLTTKSGRYWIQSKGRPYYGMEWVEGESLKNIEDFEKLGQAMAALHATASHLLTTKKTYTLKQIELLKKQDQLFRRRVSNLSGFKFKNGRWFREHREHCIHLSNEAWNILGDPQIKSLLASEPDHPSIVHGDITSPNVIISKDQLYIIDWDRIRVDSIYFELVKTIMNTTNLNPACIEALLRGYEEKKMLLPAERKLINALFRLPREAWHCIRFPKLKKSGKMLDILDQTWSLRLEAINWIEAWANQEKGNV